jgi:hypothetical protein
MDGRPKKSTSRRTPAWILGSFFRSGQEFRVVLAGHGFAALEDLGGAVEVADLLHQLEAVTYVETLDGALHARDEGGARG